MTFRAKATLQVINNDQEACDHHVTWAGKRLVDILIRLCSCLLTVHFGQQNLRVPALD